MPPAHEQEGIASIWHPLGSTEFATRTGEPANAELYSVVSNALQSCSNPCESNFRTPAFSETVRCTSSGAPSGISASISKETLSLAPGSVDRCESTSSAIVHHMWQRLSATGACWDHSIILRFCTSRKFHGMAREIYLFEFGPSPRSYPPAPMRVFL